MCFSFRFWVRSHKKAGAHFWVRTFQCLYFLLFSGLGAQNAHPEKKSVTKKVLRLSPPHRGQSPEVPFCLLHRASYAKSHAGERGLGGNDRDDSD
jgi:hypothetical protein